jgi:L-threonylcarbamoyladenylate synthase
MSEPEIYTAPGGEVSEDVIGRLAAAIHEGGIVILPTDTIYGLHCSALNHGALEAVFDMKARERRKPLIVLASNLEQLSVLGVEPPPGIESLLGSIWPAPLTAILPLHKPMPASAGFPTLAVRIPDIQWLRDLITRTGPLASTSVNQSGSPPLQSMEGLDPETRKSVAAILDIGPLQGEASTVADFASGSPRVVREGKFRFTQDLWKSSRKSL